MGEYKAYAPNHLAVVKWRKHGDPKFYTQIVRGYSEADAVRCGYLWGEGKEFNFGVCYLGEVGDAR